MAKRIAAVAFIYACTSIAWMILGNTVFTRTRTADLELRSKVALIWGGAHDQKPPSVWYCNDAKQVVELPVDASRIDASIALEPRQKGLLWYSTYRVQFDGRYTVHNNTDGPISASIAMPLPDDKAVYDDLTLSVDGKSVAAALHNKAASGKVTLEPGERAVIRARYASQGMETWKYSFGSTVSRVSDFQLHVQTNFRNIDFPENTLSPTTKHETANGWDLTWRYNNLVSGVQIAVEMPERIQPGPLAAEISYFAPVSLLFFFFLMMMITTLRGIDLHPVNYFFLAAAFFSFHLLLAYLVDHISVHAAFFICSAVSMFLVVSYLRLAIGMQFAVREAAIVQFVYLILFSYAFFFNGFTGLTVTIGAIVTLFVVMQMTGRVRWSEKFAPASA